jgi:PEP-CTERM motif
MQADIVAPRGLLQALLLTGAAVLGAALPQVAAAQTQQYSYFGAYSVRGPDGEGTNGRISSSRGDLPFGNATGNGAFISVEAKLAPLAYTRVRAINGDGSSGGFMSLSYSVVFTPTTSASLALASSWASTGQSFGSVTGAFKAEASGTAYALIRARSESGGFGVDGGRVSQSRISECGAIGEVVGPSNSAGCGEGVFAFGLFMEPFPNSSSFIGSVSMRSQVSAGGGLGPSNALAFVDPLITLDPVLEGDLVVGGGLVANAVPEPATALLALAGLGLLVPCVRARSAAYRRA